MELCAFFSHLYSPSKKKSNRRKSNGKKLQGGSVSSLFRNSIFLKLFNLPSKSCFEYNSEDENSIGKYSQACKEK